MRDKLTRSKRQSYTKSAYNGIYVSWGGVGIVRAYRRLGVSACLSGTNRNRPRRRPRSRLERHVSPTG